MGLNIAIPKELAHLKVDHRGYPIPFFVSYQNGVPEFRFLNITKQHFILENKLCGICGKKLNKDYSYVISGPKGYENKISSDSAMHRVCAEFSLQACPHLYLEKAERRTNDDLGKAIAAKPSIVIMDKPEKLFLIKISKFRLEDHGGQKFVVYSNAVSVEEYHYVNGKLEKKNK